MSTVAMFAAGEERWAQYERPLRDAFAEKRLEVELTRAPGDPAEVDYMIFAPGGPLTDFTPFTGLKAVLNLWAGVEDIVDNETLRVPLARMVDEGLTEGMVEWVTGHVLRHHLGMDAQICRQDGVWRHNVPPLARDRAVGILGLGALGQACAAALAALNFRVGGWSRSPKAFDGITSHHGEDGLAELLADSDILVLLLPLTPQTENLLDAQRLALMPEGAVLINPGRGQLIDDDALLAALDRGHLGHATLDVFREEPLPAAHPFWAHPRVTVTPHIASETRPMSAARLIAENIRRGEAGEPFLHLVDRARGY
ncbi:glyoxylate/hydroxypyruvate reductase A [Maritimibacter sp. 55A14]|uniref:2-hydroxyacid dehydrogenase n=1 Tax=Maritimibacter sp. 55A14 TaxID=2174844 RepID=UPI000D6074DE|nr:glyoxylate/hydroxypyruvate reductase A [Maritimibacter sp. 55A14]PWE32126.1 glyoxylate/hydroxypyruvate reductase A [Maritimibacter sp. 55A14]